MITARQASDALKEAAAAERRSAAAYSYSLSAPHCFVWGIVWLLGYGAEALIPSAHKSGMWVGWWWTALTTIGVAASIWIGAAQRGRNGKSGWRIGALFVVIWFYVWANFAVLAPHNDLQVGAAIPLLFAAIYAAIGLWMGLRYILVGVFMAVATLGAYFYLREYFFHWMALVGGGSLLLTGLWMRRA